MVDPFLSPSGPSDPGYGGGHRWAWPWRKIASVALSRQAVPSSVIILGLRCLNGIPYSYSIQINLGTFYLICIVSRRQSHFDADKRKWTKIET